MQAGIKLSRPDTVNVPRSFLSSQSSQLFGCAPPGPLVSAIIKSGHLPQRLIDPTQIPRPAPIKQPPAKGDLPGPTLSQKRPSSIATKPPKLVSSVSAVSVWTLSKIMIYGVGCLLLLAICPNTSILVVSASPGLPNNSM
jgi:hypothetical protein